MKRSLEVAMTCFARGAMFAVSVLVMGVPAAAQGRVTWQQIQPANSPGARSGHAMAYDAARQQVVLFGGYQWNNSVHVYFDETWLWDGTNWTQVPTAVRPSARREHAMAYDSVRQRVVLFGGHTSTGSDLGDTWEWDGNQWLPRNPASSPSPICCHAMVYDAARQEVLLNFGSDGLWTGPGEDWTWDGQDWSFRGYNSIGGRGDHGMAYDAARQRVVRLGGWIAHQMGRVDPTLEWDGSAWAQVGPLGPGSFDETVMVYDASRQRVVRFGGQATYPDTWEWDGSGWTQMLPVASPTGYSQFQWRLGHAMAYDDARQRLVLFGGLDPSVGFLNDTWEYVSLSPASFSTFGTGCPGSQGIPTLDAAPYSLPWTGDALSVELESLPTGSVPFMVVGFSNSTWSGLSLPRSLAGLGLPLCTQYVSADAVDFLTLNGSRATWTKAVPANLALIGWPLYFQGAALNAGGANALGAALSPGGQVVIGAR